MPSVRLYPLSEEFNKSATACFSLANDAVNYREQRNGRSLPIHKSKFELITELAFLKLFVSWERFLEEAFIRFMCGAQTSEGLPKNKFVTPRNLEHALDFLKQNRPYIDWTVGSDVISRALLCFENGEPFTSELSGALTFLKEMKIIRNRIAHHSNEADKAFKEMVRQKMGSVPHGLTPGKFLMSRIPSTSTMTELEEYSSVLLIAANQLAC